MKTVATNLYVDSPASTVSLQKAVPYMYIDTMCVYFVLVYIVFSLYVSYKLHTIDTQPACILEDNMIHLSINNNSEK